MTEQALPRSLTVTSPHAAAGMLWQPVLLRALFTVVFGIITVFWTSPSPAGLCLLVAAYFVTLAGAQYWVSKRLEVPGKAGLGLVLPAAHLVIAAVVLGIAGFADASGAEALFGWYGGIALALAGLGELVTGLLLRRKSVLWRDLVISAVIMVGTGALLPFFINQGAHALLGVSGGGALMAGVLWVLSGLSLRHDSRIGAKDVN